MASWQEMSCLCIISSPEYAVRNKKYLMFKGIAQEIEARCKPLLASSEMMMP